MIHPVLDPAGLQIIWSRLISISEEMFTTVWRTAFSPVVAVVQDHGCELLDAEGSCLAHAPSSMPAFNLAMPVVTRAVLARHPAATMQPGDVFITNDPWLSAGHLPDLCVVTPVFVEDRVVAFCATIAHANDIGGTNDDRRPRTVYEEGLQIPILKLYDRGVRNETLIALITANVRGPEEVIGDLEALVAANAVGSQRVAALLAEYGLRDTVELAAAIHARTEEAVAAAVAAASVKRRWLPHASTTNIYLAMPIATPNRSTISSMIGRRLQASRPKDRSMRRAARVDDDVGAAAVAGAAGLWLANGLASRAAMP